MKILKYNSLMMKRIVFAFCIVASVLSCVKQGGTVELAVLTDVIF